MRNKILMENIGKNIHRLKKSHGMTQAELAQKLGRTPGSISRIETGNSTIGVKLLVNIADLFSVSMEELIRPEGSLSHFNSVTHLLASMPEETLVSLEPFIRLWIQQYGDH